MSEEKQYPPIPQQGKNLAKFVWDVMSETLKNDNKPLLVSDEIYNQRLEICRSCEWYDEEKNTGTSARCKKCGCWLQAKARMGLDSCPIGKWSENADTFINEKFEELMKDLDKEEETN